MSDPRYQVRPICPSPTAPPLDLVVPVYNEEADLEPNVRRLRACLDKRLPSADVAHQLLPAVRDTGRLFDAKVLVLAERARLRVHEVPVDWVDDPNSRVDIGSTAVADLRGVWRLLRRRTRAPLRAPTDPPAPMGTGPGIP